MLDGNSLPRFSVPLLLRPPIRPGNQIPRLEFRRERGAARHRSLGNGSGRYQRHDSRPRGFTGAGVQRRRTAGRDAWQATPTLIKLSPAPVRKIIGDLGEEAKVLLALGLQQRTT